MKNFFSEKQFTTFDWLALYFICRAAEIHSGWWVLLVIPQIFISVILANYFIERSCKKAKETNE